MWAALTIEALAPVRFEYEGEAVHLRRGERITLPVPKAQRLLALARGKVRTVQLPDWLVLWREVAEASTGLRPDDPRVPVVVKVIECELDPAFERGDVAAFLRAIAGLRVAMQEVSS